MVLAAVLVFTALTVGIKVRSVELTWIGLLLAIWFGGVFLAPSFEERDRSVPYNWGIVDSWDPKRVERIRQRLDEMWHDYQR
jgi:hypothetical protein